MGRFVLQLIILQLIVFLNVAGFFLSNKIKTATKYELQQKVFTLGTSYTVKDDQDQSVYKIGFKKISLGKHLQLTDISGQKEYYSIKHILNPLGLAKYEIRQNDDVIADVKRKINLFGGTKFKINSKYGELKIEGDFVSREFTIKRDHKIVATISKKFFAIGDKYGIKIEQDQDVPFILALAIVVDEVVHD
ncbi:unnamed protein product [Rotaria sp. Silwood1]|nr:unnamed protein product [Rotaria sp. Silwood1]CAF3357150.1 unnamed protein product [Rotaria sp. Silwood1]CAF3362226.1 unnamed protein product [Rotaria sp. Silwood1]CAF4542942.1 unnamed protein product [Rotaria sp. Silwood1]CAF4587848.1 unnamed protein product [Rotaria sp. Silwood1]